MNRFTRMTKQAQRAFSGLLAWVLLFSLVSLGTAAGEMLPQSSQAAVDNPNTLYFPLVRSPYPWKTQAVDDQHFFGDLGSRSIAVNSASMACVVYGNDHLFVRCNKNDWAAEVIDADFGVGRWASAVFDDADRLHVAYYDEFNGALRHAYQNGSGWTVEIVERALNQDHILSSREGLVEAYLAGQDDLISPEGVTSFKWGLGGYPSIAVDHQGQVHISYFDITNENLKYAIWSDGQWKTETVDAPGAMGQYNSIGVNDSGTVYIAYYDGTNQDLKLATRSGTTWSLAVLDSYNRVGQYASLAIASDGTPRISYYSVDGGALMYWNGQQTSLVLANAQGGLGLYSSLALDSHDLPWIAYYDDSEGFHNAHIVHQDGKYWTLWWIDYEDVVGRNTSLAVGPDDRPQVVYYHSSNNQLRVSIGSPGGEDNGWSFWKRVIDVTTTTGIYTGIDVDDQDRPGIVYLNDSQSYLMYTEWTGSIWQPSIVSSLNDTGVEASLDIGPYNVPFVSFWQYRGGTETEMRFAYRDNGVWYPSTVDVGYNLGNFSSVSADSHLNAHVSYYDSIAGDLKYAKLVSGVWLVETVDSAVDVGQYTSLDLDSSEMPWISYYDVTNGDLKLAHKNGANWVIETVDSGGTVGAGTSLLLNGSNQARIAYLDVSNGRLKYAAWTGSAWAISFVDPQINVGGDPTLQLDAAGRPHITYYDFGRYNLKYAYQTAAGWVIETIDSPGDVGRFNDFVLTADGVAHVAYFDATNGDLKYATRVK